MKNKKTKIAIIAVIALVLVTIGASYAYWLITRTQEGENVITTGCLDISLNGSGDITLTDQFPLSDADGMKLTPFTFTVTNNCTTSVDYQVALESLEIEGDVISPSSIKVVLNEKTPMLLSEKVSINSTIEDAYEAYRLQMGTLTPKDTEGASTTYNLRLWIDENADIAEMNKTFKSKITITATQDLDQFILKDKIIADYGGVDNITELDSTAFATVTSDGESGLYKAEDDYGTSYYLRGDVTNNYVKFGKNANEEELYWRIIRINGDGTIRMIYDGTEALENGVDRDATIDTSAYNTYYDTANTIGYTYNNSTGIQTDSEIKTKVENWYATNLETNYNSYIADRMFCNDRYTVSTNTPYLYGAYTRIIENNQPELICLQDTDRYTVNSDNGNGLLSNPIGLITADEVVMAGGASNSENINYYLYSGSDYYTISPYVYSLGGGAYASIFSVDATGAIVNKMIGRTNVGVRPVINIKSDVIFVGNGTIDSPYKIVD